MPLRTRVLPLGKYPKIGKDVIVEQLDRLTDQWYEFAETARVFWMVRRSWKRTSRSCGWSKRSIMRA